MAYGGHAPKAWTARVSYAAALAPSTALSSDERIANAERATV